MEVGVVRVDDINACQQRPPIRADRPQKRIFISSPYRPTNGMTVEENKAQANKYALRALLAGYLPFVPHTQYEYLYDFYRDNALRANEEAIRLSCLEVEYCDEIWAFGPLTEGMAREVERAKDLGIPVVAK